MLDRREFLKIAAATSGAILMNPSKIFSTSLQASYNYFAVHPFIEQNPDAVFIMHTNVDVKTNSAAIKQAGLAFGRSVFTNTDDQAIGIALTHNIAIKPNLTSRGKWQSGYTIEGTMGVITDVYFVEGMIESMKELAIPADQFYVREVNGTENLTEGGYAAMGQRTGADVQVINTKVDQLSPGAVQWMDVPEEVWFNKIPFLWPINSPGSWLLNLAKFKTHAMGLTLCAKNLQGSIAASYQQHCNYYNSDMSISSEHIQPNAKSTIMDNYNRHVADEIPRWDRPGQEGGIWQETWATRNLDNNSVTKPGLHVIEGVYGRDGHFVVGPNDGYALDYMTNIIIFGKKPYNVDIIGHWLGGHEPGNFGLFHLAKERGLSSVLNPMDIPVYEWNADGTASKKSLTDFQRTELKTLYLRRDYNGQSEDEWHLCNEPFDYPATGVALNRRTDRPKSFILNQNYPNPFNPSTSIQFILPERGNARLEIFNSRGETVQVLVDGLFNKGSHLAVWNTRNIASGTYFYRLQFKSFSELKKMTLVR